MDPIEVAKARGVLDFWQRVQGFAEMGIPQRGWDGVESDHPIVAAVGGRLLKSHIREGHSVFYAAFFWCIIGLGLREAFVDNTVQRLPLLISLQRMLLLHQKKLSIFFC